MNSGTQTPKNVRIITARNIQGPCMAASSPVVRKDTMPSIGPIPCTGSL